MKTAIHRWPAIGLLLALLFVTVVRIGLLSAPMERDEGEYAYAGQLMLAGVPPYQGIYNMKMPGTYAVYAASMALFGQSVSGVRVGLLLANLGAILLVYAIGRRFMTPTGAAAAGATYALMSTSPGVLGTYMHATHFVILPALAATLLLLSAIEKQSLWGIFTSGCLYGLAFLMKQPGGLFALLGFALLFRAAVRQTWKQNAARLALFGLGIATPIALTCFLLWEAGVWSRFWWWTVTYAGMHATVAPWSQGKVVLANRIMGMGIDLEFWASAELGLVLLFLDRGQPDKRFFLITLLLVSAAAVCPTLHFSSHYFVMLLPAIALLSTEAFDLAARWLETNCPEFCGLPWMIFGLMSMLLVWSHSSVFFSLSPAQVTAAVYPNNEFQAYPEVGEYLVVHTPPNSTMAILGSEPELLFYAHRCSVTGYVYMYDIVQDQPYRKLMERGLIHEVEQGKPDYVVLVNQRLSWLADTRAELGPLTSWIIQFTDGYEPFGAVSSGRTHQCVWGPNSFKEAPNRLLSIYRRKKKPQ